MIKRTDIEIMAPVGCYESLHAAINAGANSVYFGIGRLNMRSASAANFSEADMEKIVEIAHNAGVKTYLTVNTIIYDDELKVMQQVVDKAKEVGVDAIIASDLAVITYAYHVGVEVHISTQCNISNSEAVKFFSQWADVVVLAREVSLEQIAEVHRCIVEQDIRGPKGELVEIEMFAHGALCMSISGKCYLSQHETNCSANRGACRQICRRKYTIQDKDTGEMLDIDGRYILSPKDLCTIDFLDQFINAGVRVLKIEGRARYHARRVLRQYEILKCEMDFAVEQLQGKISLGATPQMAQTLMKSFLPLLISKFPNLELSIVTAPKEQLEQQIQEEKLHFAILLPDDSSLSEELQCTPLQEFGLGYIMSKPGTMTQQLQKLVSFARLWYNTSMKD